MSTPHPIEVPVSVAYVVVDRGGRALVEVDAFEEATRLSRQTIGAVAVLGAPSGILLARVAHGDSVWSDDATKRAARMWARGAAAP